VNQTTQPGQRQSWKLFKDIADAVMYFTDAATVIGHILRIDCGAQFGG